VRLDVDAPRRRRHVRFDALTQEVRPRVARGRSRGLDGGTRIRHGVD
jgi:hypothetical protein